jgi:predicted dehydrogenase
VTAVAIVGCGLVGGKRARALGEDPDSRLVVVADSDRARAERLAEAHAGCEVVTDWRAAVEHRKVELVIVATTNDALALVTGAAVERGKHVLVEKPAARNAEELAPILETAKASGQVVKVGFNHRFHPGLRRAWELFRHGAVGPAMYIRARYGHGGRPGYEREWRANRARSGGGELLDQGVHLIDLARWFLGDFVEVRGQVATFFWPMLVEDNGFLSLRTAAGQIAWLHASCTEWRNLFSFEIFGRDGKLQVDGLGGSYGVERLTFYRMLPQMGPPETTAWEFPGEDVSWAEEYRHLRRCIETGESPAGTLGDAMAALEVVRQAYEQNGVASPRSPDGVAR